MKKTEYIWVKSNDKDNEGDVKAMHLTDFSHVEDNGDSPFVLDITGEMAKADIPVKVPDNIFFRGKIGEGLIVQVIDENEAEKAFKEWDRKAKVKRRALEKETKGKLKAEDDLVKDVRARFRKTIDELSKEMKQDYEKLVEELDVQISNPKGKSVDGEITSEDE